MTVWPAHILPQTVKGLIAVTSDQALDLLLLE